MYVHNPHTSKYSCLNRNHSSRLRIVGTCAREYFTNINVTLHHSKGGMQLILGVRRTNNVAINKVAILK